MSKLNSKQNVAIVVTKEQNLSESEFAELQTTQEIEERVSKSFLAIDTFTPELQSGGSGSGSGTGSGGCGGYHPSGSGTGSTGGCTGYYCSVVH